MKFKRLIKTLNMFSDRDLIVHFRIGTSGGFGPTFTHPFPLSKNPEELRKTYWVSDIGIAHNGILYGLGSDKESDTQQLIREYIFPLKDKLRDPAVLNLLEFAVRNSRLAIMTKEKVVMIGCFIEHNGVYYSNDTFNKQKIWMHRFGSGNKQETKDYLLDDEIFTIEGDDYEKNCWGKYDW